MILTFIRRLLLVAGEREASVTAQDTKKWWETDVNRVIEETDVFYNRVAEICPDKAKVPFTKKKIIEARGWAPSLKLYDKHFETVLKQLGFFYVPNRIIPGPAFIFPIRDVDGKLVSAQTKPLETSLLAIPGMKYRYIGDKQNQIGPRWLGNDYATLKKIIDMRKVVVVEGGFDLLAARLMCPDYPIISPLTKVVGRQHQAYLRMLGVTDLFLLYDNEVAKEGEEAGAGNMSAAQQAATIKTMNVKVLSCPKSDPSECLKIPVLARELQHMLTMEFEY
jgi:hypothetical protein